MVSLLFLLFKNFEIATIYKSLFFFLLSLFTPFLVIGKTVLAIPVIFFGLIIFYLILAKTKGWAQSITFALFLTGWVIYGIRCLVLLSGGA
jgi:uncharacterized membrane protein YozB (DUF420 family)